MLLLPGAGRHSLVYAGKETGFGGRGGAAAAAIRCCCCCMYAAASWGSVLLLRLPLLQVLRGWCQQRGRPQAGATPLLLQGSKCCRGPDAPHCCR
jgi:hypothetical protein